MTGPRIDRDGHPMSSSGRRMYLPPTKKRDAVHPAATAAAHALRAFRKDVPPADEQEGEKESDAEVAALHDSIERRTSQIKKGG